MRQVVVEQEDQLSLFEVGPNMTKIREFFGEMKRATRAAQTLKGYASDWRDFTSFCRSTGRTEMPASGETIALYVSAKLKDPTVCVSTMERHVAAIAFRHRQEGKDVPDRRDARSVLNGVRRARKEQPLRRAAMTPEQLRKICGRLYTEARQGSIIAARNRAVLTLGFGTGLRRSNLAAFNFDDVRFVKGKGMVLLVRSSKTDQVGKGQAVRVLYGKRAATCPVKAMRAWLRIRGEDRGPLFFVTRMDRWGHEVIERTRMGGPAVNLLVKKMLKGIGVHDSNYGGHSLRAGFVTTANCEGASPLAIMEYTGHTTVEMVNRYVRPIDQFPSRSPLGNAL